jgi:hypothetical protein
LDPNTKRKIKSRYERLKKMQKEGEHMQYIW